MAPKQYTVQSGDSLFSIGKKLGTVPEGIYLLNHLDSDMLQIGQILKIPASVEAQTLYDLSLIHIYFETWETIKTVRRNV